MSVDCWFESGKNCSANSLCQVLFADFKLLNTLAHTENLISLGFQWKEQKLLKSVLSTGIFTLKDSE